LRLKYELDPEAMLWVADALQRLGNDTGLAWLDAAMGEQTTAQRAGELAIGICNERDLALTEQPTWEELRGHMRKLHEQWRRTGVGSRPGVEAPAVAPFEPLFAAHLVTTKDTPLRPIDDARFVLTKCGALPIPMLARTCQAEESYLRTMVLKVLAEIGPLARGAAPSVMPLLGHPISASDAIRTLGESGATDAIPALRTFLSARDTELRAAATQALGLLHDAQSAPALARRLADPQEAPDVRVGAAFALLCFGEHPDAEAFFAEREQKGDYHPPTLRALRERLAAMAR
jgi:hypothetical protein